MVKFKGVPLLPAKFASEDFIQSSGGSSLDSGATRPAMGDIEYLPVYIPLFFIMISSLSHYVIFVACLLISSRHSCR